MQREDRVVHFSTELFHPPVARPVPQLQELYYALSKTRAGYQSTEFVPNKPIRFYSVKAGKSRSNLLFLPDRIVVIEEWPDITVSEFCENVETVGRHVLETAGPDRFVAQTVLIRSTFALTAHADSRVFMMERVCKLQEQLPHLGRPIATGGLRFVLPQTPEHRGTLHVHIDSFAAGGNELLAEIRGVYDRQVLASTELGAVSDNIRAVRTFISDNVYAFLRGFDVLEKPFHPGD